MYVCNCAGVTQRQIKQAVDYGATTVKQLKTELGVASGCRQCACDARQQIFGAMLQSAAATAMAFPVGQAATVPFA